MVEAPIFHVNGDDPEAVVHAARVATEFRQRFHKDVVIDMFCYRRFGHNEGDEPMFTQPLMYTAIKSHKTTLQLYTERLVADGLIPEGEIEDMKAAFQAHLNAEFEAGREFRPNKADWLDGRWSGMGKREGRYQRGKTAVEMARLKKVGAALTRLPESFQPHKTVQRMLDAKRAMIETGEGLDWATAEALAFGTLLAEGFPVRLSGQDSTRGTFSQRHSGIIDQETEERYLPLNHIEPGQASFEVVDSMLSEYAVLGYEYGYSLAEPNALVLWEAQFGDFVNGAQIMIDQFISSGEAKWLRMSGLVMLLPHGYEGQGPEHSSARPERFLQMCAGDNWIVANCTTPANYFHILRRQIHRSFRKPLVLMTPKSLLRHKLAVSKLKDLAKGSSFHRVLWDDADRDRGAATRRPSCVPDEQDQAGRALLGQGLLRPAGGARRPRPRRRLPDAARAVLPVPGAVAHQGARPLQAGADRLVPGGAEEPGLLVLRRAEPRVGARPHRGQARPADLRRPPGGRLAGDRARARAQGAAGGARRRGADRQEGALRP